MSLGATGLGALTGLALGGNGRSAALGAALGYVASKVQRREPIFSGGNEHKDGGYKKSRRRRRSLSRKRSHNRRRRSPKKRDHLGSHLSEDKFFKKIDRLERKGDSESMALRFKMLENILTRN
jgi:hypothetical protein